MQRARKRAKRSVVLFRQVAVSLLLSYSALICAADLQPPVISVAGIHSPTVSMDGARLICTVRVENPNDVALPVSGGIVDLHLDGAHAARGRPRQKVSIPARAARNVDLLVDLTSNAAVAWLPLFLGDSAFSLPYRVIGHVDIDSKNLGRVKFNETGKVTMTADGLAVYPDQ